MAQKIKLTDEITQKLCQSISEGLPYELACNLNGVPYEMFTQWMNAGKAGEEKKYVDFYNQVITAEENFRNEHLERIKEAAKKGNKQASTWLKERGIE